MHGVPPLAQRAVARNDPCPCGSGRRYKDCHGSLRGAAPLAAVAQSRYRPAGDDWSDLSGEDRDRLGVVMEKALEHQLQQRLREAERAYRAVLEQAPRTHDALHMLGVIRLGLGDFADAERLIKAAMRLRPPYAAIEKNWSLVRRSMDARDRRGIELLSEAALPLLFDTLCMQQAASAARPAGRKAALHIVGGRSESVGDADFVARRLATLLAPLRPELWHDDVSTHRRSQWQRLDLHALDPGTARRPRDGDVIVVGVEADTDAWLRPPIERVLVFALSSAPSLYLERLRRIGADGARSIAIVAESRAKARRFGSDALVVPPPVELPPPKVATAVRGRESQHGSRGAKEAGVLRVATLGRDGRPGAREEGVIRVATLGQDGRRIVAAADVDLLDAVATRSHLSLYDPGPLRYELGMLSRVRCVSRGETTFAELVEHVDVYLHRPLPWWAEDCGHAFFGAMARGVPALCHRDSIYAEYVDDGVDGWIYDDSAGASATLDALRRDASQIAAAGDAARAKAARLFEPQALSRAYIDVVESWRARA